MMTAQTAACGSGLASGPVERGVRSCRHLAKQCACEGLSQNMWYMSMSMC